MPAECGVDQMPNYYSFSFASILALATALPAIAQERRSCGGSSRTRGRDFLYACGLFGGAAQHGDGHDQSPAGLPLRWRRSVCAALPALRATC